MRKQIVITKLLSGTAWVEGDTLEEMEEKAIQGDWTDEKENTIDDMNYEPEWMFADFVEDEEEI